jgi:hypothetical protein
MRVAIVSVFVDYHRRGRKNRLSLQPQIGPLIAALLPPGVDIDIWNETFDDVDWSRDYDLVFISALHSDFDRARQVSRYWRRRGAATVFGGPLASAYPGLCAPYFDSVVVGDPETTVPRLYRDFCAGKLEPRYVGVDGAPPHDVTPRFDLLAGKAHHPLCFEATRGCPFTCDFCVLTGLGTRYHARPVSTVIRDIVAGQRMLDGRIPDFKRRIVGFCDNNIGGSLTFLRELCEALVPLRIQWYGSATFNVIANRDLVRAMARSGCRALFVGLESFNPEAIADMRKFQNVLRKTREVLEFCRRQGILIASGLLASPIVDDTDYLRRLPDLVAESGLSLPVFLAFETPIPGTQYFRRLSREREPAFLPNALLRDFAGYTLVVRPRKCSADEFVAAYRDAERATFAPARRLPRVVADVAQLTARGGWFPALIELAEYSDTIASQTPAPMRTYIAGTDTPPPERVPLAEADFDGDADRASIVEPWKVTDADGRALARWLGSEPVFAPRRAMASRRDNGDEPQAAEATVRPAGAE